MGAPKGNKYAEGHGRPPIHTDPNEVQRLIDDYFEWIKGEYKEEEIFETIETKEGNKEKVGTGDFEMICVRRPEPPTVTGLSLHLGFNSKSTLYEYAEKESFSNSIKRAISKVEKHHEIQIAYGDKCTGNIFALKNFGWKDKLETDNTHTGEIKVNITRKIKE